MAMSRQYGPMHVAPRSHSETGSRQIVPGASYVSAGHDDDVPVQFSAGSHTLTDARHWVDESRKLSGGQFGDTGPRHASSTSQTPTAARQTRPDGA